MTGSARLTAWAAACAGLAMACQAGAQPISPATGAYPQKPVTVVVGAARGGDTDLVARLVMQELGRRWHSAFVVENRIAVMGSVMALQYVSKQPADGYTLNVASGSTYLNAALVSKMPLNVLSALDPVAQLTASPLLLVVSESLPVRDLREFIDYVRSHPGQLSYASTGLGGGAHLAAEYLKHELKLSIAHVAYQGVSLAYKDMAEGRVQMGFGMAISARTNSQKGKLRVLAVTSARRLPALPAVPALAELVPSFEYISFIGVVAPAGTPRPVIDALNKGLNETLAVPSVHRQLSAGGMSLAPATPEDFRKSIRQFISRVGDIVKDARLDLRQNQ